MPCKALDRGGAGGDEDDKREEDGDEVGSGWPARTLSVVAGERAAHKGVREEVTGSGWRE